MALIAGVQYSGTPAGTILPCGHGIPITSISAASPAVVTTTLNHNLVTGDLVVITGTSTTPSTINTYTVTVTGNTTFTIPVTVTGAGGAVGVVSKIPPRMLLCDGQSYLRADYPTLFAVIGTSFGSANINSFNVPDFRGRFLRGVTAASANDPDSSGRTTMNTGSNTGNNVGSVQGHGFQTHNHTATTLNNYVAGLVSGPYSIPGGGNVSANNSYTPTIANATASGATSQATANETRPVNAYVNYCIAY